MLIVIATALPVFLLLTGYRLLWRRRYNPKRIDGHFVRVQGRIAGRPGEVVLRRTESGELLRARGFLLEVRGASAPQPIDLRSAWLLLVGRTVRRGERVTVDGLPGSQPTEEALYRQAAVRPVLEALRVSPGTWPEHPLLWLPAAFAALLLVIAVVLPRVVPVPMRASSPIAFARTPPQLPLACPAGTRKVSGELEARCVDAAGKAQGPALVAYSDYDRVRIHETGQFLDGEKHGLWLTLYWDGSLAEDESFSRGKRIGCWRSYFETGGAKRIWCFRDGQSHGFYARWIESGQIVELGLHERGRKQGLWQTWSQHGELLSEGHYLRDRRVGTWQLWDHDGGRSARGAYRDGRHDGLWRFWHPTGHLAGRGHYREGIKEGQWLAFYPSGRPAAVAEYAEGKRLSLRIWREEQPAANDPALATRRP
jgi:antitoxin component YwqK of YwqJK toxin-antitoxin module